MFCLLTLILFITSDCLASEEKKTGKVIEWGWGTPSPIYIRDHIREMERLAFDGLVIDLRISDSVENNKRMSNNIWSFQTLKIQDYQRSFDALANTQFRKFTDNFLLVYVVPGNVDWYDNHFSSVIHNITTVASIAQSLGFKGLFIDVEQYQEKIFDYNSRPQRTIHNFDDYRRCVRQRGREFMKAINTAYPDVTIFLTYGYQVAYMHGKSLKTSVYGLLTSFLDGMLETASPGTLIFDGFEFSYPYKKKSQFGKAYESIYKQGFLRTEVKEAFDRHYRASFALWLDYRKKWNSQDFSENYYSPQEFENSLRFALSSSDRYVWIYSEKACWWYGKMPEAYKNALEKAQKK